MAGELCDLIGPNMGSISGRLDPQNYAGVDGTFAFVFGSDVPGVFGDLEVGDSISIKQDLDFTSLTLLTFRVKFVHPDNAAALNYRFRAFVAASELFSLEPAEGSTSDFVARTLRVDQFSGTQTLRFELDVTP